MIDGESHSKERDEERLIYFDNRRLSGSSVFFSFYNRSPRGPSATWSRMEISHGKVQESFNCYSSAAVPEPPGMLLFLYRRMERNQFKLTVALREIKSHSSAAPPAPLPHPGIRFPCLLLHLLPSIKKETNFGNREVDGGRINGLWTRMDLLLNLKGI